MGDWKYFNSFIYQAQSTLAYLDRLRKKGNTHGLPTYNYGAIVDKNNCKYKLMRHYDFQQALRKFDENTSKDTVVFITYFSREHNVVKLKVMTLGDISKVYY
jgi:hypothetical protein